MSKTIPRGFRFPELLQCRNEHGIATCWKGLDQQWNEVEASIVRHHIPLCGRYYIFRVQGATSGGVWTEPSVQIRIEILPRWWNAFWFRASSGAVLLLSRLAATTTAYIRLQEP